MDYFNEKLGRVQTEAELAILGVVMTPEVLSALSLYPMQYALPEHNSNLYDLMPEGDPQKQGDRYVQEFRLAPRPVEGVKSWAALAIDADTSARILAGFTYDIDPGTGTVESLHFSYDAFDQQNFADTANMALLLLSGSSEAEASASPTTVTWNAYRNWTADAGGELVRLTLDVHSYLALYTQGALAHKVAQMDTGGQRKALVAAAESTEAIAALFEEWGL